MIDGKPFILGRPVNRGAGAWLRCTQHLEILDRKGLAICPVVDEMTDDPELAWKAKCLADVFVGSGWPVGDFFPMMAKWIDGGKPVVWDVDDDPLNISPYNFAYEFFGTQEVKLVEPINGQDWLWRNGVGQFDIDRNRKRNEDFLLLLRNLAAITTTTPYLAAKLMALAPGVPVYIRPNVLDFENIWPHHRRISTDGKVRIVYEGGSSHAADLDTVLPVLGQIAEDYPHVVFVFNGDTAGHSKRVIPEERMEVFEWVSDYPTFARRFANIGADIAIAPLCMDEIHGEFNRCKSSLKWLDAAALAIPCVCQKDTPYREVVNFLHTPDGMWNGILADTHEEWYAALTALIQSREMREVIGNNAQREAWRWWNADDFAEEHMRQYQEVLGGNGRNDHAQSVPHETCAADR